MTGNLISAGAIRPTLLAGMLVFCVGCGGEAGSTKVSGTITLDGKPVDGAAVSFIGREGAKLATAQTDSAGKFTLTAALGKNVVTVAKASANPAPAPEVPMEMPSEAEYQKMIQKIKSEFPARYGDPKTSGLSFDVVEGMEPLEIGLSSG
jgi:hypothetical protein